MQSLSHKTTEQGASCVGGREDECADAHRILSITMELCRPRVLHSSLAPWVHIRRGTSARPDTRRPIVGSTPGAARAVSRRQQERISDTHSNHRQNQVCVSNAAPQLRCCSPSHDAMSLAPGWVLPHRPRQRLPQRRPRPRIQLTHVLRVGCLMAPLQRLCTQHAVRTQQRHTTHINASCTGLRTAQCTMQLNAPTPLTCPSRCATSLQPAQQSAPQCPR
jgi:hypothetical protein